MQNVLLKWASLSLVISLFTNVQLMAAQDDTVRVQFTKTAPVIDGVGDDDCWNNDSIEWQEIDQVWMPWGGTIPSDDFNGKYMVCWNKDSNLLYFLAETTDDSYITNYVCGNDGYPSYDILELFIDPDRSGGYHLIDGTGSVWGIPRGNGENAFSHHIAIDVPDDGASTNSCCVMDLGGTASDANPVRVQYTSHFPEIVVSRSGQVLTWEFSLKVYNDTYTSANPEASRKPLEVDDVMGFTAAYCDADGAVGRDHFIASVPGNGSQLDTEGGQQIYNQAWKNCDAYGVFKLMDTAAVVVDPPTASGKVLTTTQVEVIPTRVAGQMKVNVNSAAVGMVNIEILDLAGRQVTRFVGSKVASSFSKTCDMTTVARGLYMVRVSVGGTTSVQKIVKL